MESILLAVKFVMLYGSLPLVIGLLGVVLVEGLFRLVGGAVRRYRESEQTAV